MFDFEEKYFKIMRLSLRMNGLWIDQNVSQRLIGFLVWNIAGATMALPMVVMLLKEYKNLYIFMENSILLLIYFGMNCKFAIAFLSITKMKALHLKISSDWQIITNNFERAILKKYCDRGHRLAKFYFLYCILIHMVFTSRPFLPLLANIILPLPNGTRSPAVPYYSDYICFDQADYLYWVCAYLFAIYTMIFFPFMVGIESYYMQSVSHTCGLFAVTCHRIKMALDIPDVDERPHKFHRNIQIRNNLKQAVILHAHAIRSIELLQDLFSKSFLAVNIVCTVGLGLGGVYTTFIRNDSSLVLRSIVMFVGTVIHLFIINLVGQQLIDSSDEVFYSAYFSEWYLMSPKTRKYVHLIMMRSYYPCKLTAGKLMDVSMEIFGMLIRNAASYFTIFLSLT